MNLYLVLSLRTHFSFLKTKYKARMVQALVEMGKSGTCF